jgi:hypothetical protein
VIDQASVERAAERFRPPDRSFERLVNRRARKQRNRRIATGVLAFVVAIAGMAGLVRAFRTAERPIGHEPTKDIFDGVHGWIAYGGRDGIWALDPNRPTDPEATIQLSTLAGEPIAWSNDGSTLLVLRATFSDGTVTGVTNDAPGVRQSLDVLHANGTETRVVTFAADVIPLIMGSSLSPDGSQVVYVDRGPDPDSEAIYVVDSDGGTPQLIRSTSMEPFVIEELGWRGQLQWPTFSPDGTRIAYFHGGGDHSQNLKVMDADGTDAHGLFGERRLDWHVSRLIWSPDGQQLAFATDHPDGIWGVCVIGADGLDYRHVAARGEDPSWSPDGSRIAFRRGRTLYTVTSDGSDLQEIGEVSSDGAVAWNPVG